MGGKTMLGPEGGCTITTGTIDAKVLGIDPKEAAAEYARENKRAKAREYMRKWNAAHPEKRREYNRRYYENHREEYLAK